MENLLKGKKSIVWNFFTPESEIKAVCNFCRQILSYKSSITNLKQHILKKHPSIKLQSTDNRTNSNTSINDNSSLAMMEHSYSEQTASNIQILPSCSQSSHANIESSSTQDSLATASKVPILKAANVTGTLNNKPRSVQTTLVVPKKIGFSQKKKNHWTISC